VGRTHLVHEYLGTHPAKLRINFRDPSEILDKSRFAQARVGTAVWAYVGAIGEISWFGRLLHLGGYRFGGWQLEHRGRRLVDPNGAQVSFSKAEYATLAATTEWVREE
jgi:hypothetical protein